MNALEIRGLTRKFKDFTLGPLDLTLPGGCVLGLIGENGAGKTTLLRLILQMLKKDGGSVRVLGRDEKELDGIREDLGVVPDATGLPLSFNALEMDRMLAGIHKAWDEEKFFSLIKAFDLPEKKPFKDYSRGMRQKMCIAAALSHDPKLLLLDEPTGGLDPLARDQVMEMLEDYTRSEERSVLISSHIVSDLERLCDYVAFLHKGRLLLVEEKDRLQEELALFLGTAEELDALPKGAVQGVKHTPYGERALVRRDRMPEGAALSSVGVEEMFLLLTKEGEKR